MTTNEQCPRTRLQLKMLVRCVVAPVCHAHLFARHLASTCCDKGCKHLALFSYHSDFLKIGILTKAMVYKLLASS
jgi:hypothetical protein